MRVGVANVHVQQLSMFLFAVLPRSLACCSPIKNLVPMCAKVIYISYTCWATYNNQITTSGQEVHKFYLFLAYWGVSKYQTKVAYFAPRLDGPTAECFQLQGGGPVIDPRYRLALRARHESYSRLLSTPLFSTWRRP